MLAPFEFRYEPRKLVRMQARDAQTEYLETALVSIGRLLCRKPGTRTEHTLSHIRFLRWVAVPFDRGENHRRGGDAAVRLRRAVIAGNPVAIGFLAQSEL